MISGQQAALEPNALGSALIILLTTSTNSNQKKIHPPELQTGNWKGIIA